MLSGQSEELVMGRFGVGIAVALVVSAGAALGQSSTTTVETQAETTEGDGRQIVINQVSRTVRERDPCQPIANRLDSERCEAALQPTRTIYVLNGTKRTIRFDRPVTVVELDAYPEGAIDIVPSETNTAAIISATRTGRAEAFFFGQGTVARRNSGGPAREVLLALTVVSVDNYDAAEPPHSVRTIVPTSRRPLQESGVTYKCTSFECNDPLGR